MRLQLLTLLAVSVAACAAAGPEADLALTIKAYYSASIPSDWQGIEKIGGIQWAPLPPNELQNCLPDGGCFTRQGKAVIAGRNLVAMATGARTIVSNLYLRNAGPAFGEAAVLGALKAAGFSAELARCPVAGSAGGTNWYRLKGQGANPGVLSVQTSCNGRPCEGFVLSRGAELPALQPAQLRLYSEQCGAPAAERKTVAAAGMPHEQLSQTLVALIPATSGRPLHEWKSLDSLAPGIEWTAGGPKKVDLSSRNDPNPFMQSGQASYAGRKFSVMASGSPTEAKAFYFEEMGTHPKGEHLLGEVYKRGVQVKLVRCGPVYTSSTNNWYSLTGANIHPAMIRQSISYDGERVAETYELRLDNILPKRDPRDRDPGVGGCR